MSSKKDNTGPSSSYNYFLQQLSSHAPLIQKAPAFLEDVEQDDIQEYQMAAQKTPSMQPKNEIEKIKQLMASLNQDYDKSPVS